MNDGSKRIRVMNASRGSVVADHVRVASSLRDRMVGLLATPEVPPGEGLLIEHTTSIHMFFMRYPIDAAFIDRHGRVSKTVHRLKPWRVVFWAWGARDCLELRAGALEESGTRVGDQLEIRPAAEWAGRLPQ